MHLQYWICFPAEMELSKSIESFDFGQLIQLTNKTEVYVQKHFFYRCQTFSYIQNTAVKLQLTKSTLCRADLPTVPFTRWKHRNVQYFSLRQTSQCITVASHRQRGGHTSAATVIASKCGFFVQPDRRSLVLENDVVDTDNNLQTSTSIRRECPRCT